MFLLFCAPYFARAERTRGYNLSVHRLIARRFHGLPLEPSRNSRNTYSHDSWRREGRQPDGRWKWVYNATEAEIDWGFQMDWKYLQFLRDNKPVRFLKEMTPNPQHDGTCEGLDLKHPHHQALQREFQADVQRVCREKGLSRHPALTRDEQAYYKRQWLRVLFKYSRRSDQGQNIWSPTTFGGNVVTQLLKFFNTYPGLQRFLARLMVSYNYLPTETDRNGFLKADRTAVDALQVDKNFMLSTLLALEPVPPKAQSPTISYTDRDKNIELLTCSLGLNLEAKESMSHTPIHFAFSFGYFEVIPALIRAGVHLESTDDRGNTALLRAVIAKRLDLIQMMVEHGAQINVSNKQRENALHLVARAGNGIREQEMVAYLLEQGVSGVAHNVKGKKPDEAACLAGNTELADFISDAIINLKISQLPKARLAHAVGSPCSGIRAIQRRNRKSTLKRSLGEIIKFDEAEFTDTQVHHVRDSFFCSGVFKRRDGQLYVGKSNHIFTEDSAEAHACAEKIALDIYAYFGVPVPETALARLPIIFPEGVRAKDLPEISDDRTHTVYLMSEVLAGFHAVSTVPKFEGGEHFYLQLPGQENVLKVVNFGRMLAVAKIIDDPDVLGDSANNFVCQIVGNQINCIKIDANTAFNANPVRTVGPREVMIAMKSDYHTIKVDDLPVSVKKEFIETIALFTQISVRDLAKFFVRRGTENLLAFHAGKNLRQMPQVLLKRQAIFKAEYAAEFSEVTAQDVESAPLQRKKVSDEDISANLQHQKQSLLYTKFVSEPTTEAIQYTIHHSDLTYRLEDCIGSGSFAQVYRGLWKGREVAIKKLMLQQNLLLETGYSMRQEAAIMHRLNHPNVMPLYGICVDPGHTSLVFKYLPNGSLFHMINDPTRVLDWPMRLKLSLGIAKGIQYLHTQSILHRDLKSLNVLLDATDSPVIADFGLSKVKTETHASMAQTKTAASSVGTISWMAPELFKRKGKHTRASDVFAFAVILWELAARKIPWSDDNTTNEFNISSWVKDGERNDIPKNTPKPFAALIARCWIQTRRDRPKVVEITKALTAMHLEAKTAKDNGTLEATLWSERAVTASDTLTEPKAASSSDASW